jgi:peroxiredoxin
VALNTKVIVISFGSVSGAQTWLTETCTTFELLLDGDRTAYDAYGLEHSLFRSWNVKTMMTYARLLFQGKKWRGIQGDSGQLGGDYFIDKNGIIQLVYRSNDPTDRPTVEQLLNVLKGSTPKSIGAGK